MKTAKKSIYNIVFGLLGQLITIAIGVLLPRLFLLSYGSEVNGFLSSINQIFSYLTLLEMGVGSATIQALYGPIGKEDKVSISGIMSATNIFYQRTARFYMIGVVVLAILYPVTVQSEMPKLLQMAIILIVGCCGVISYCFQAKYKLLLRAEGKQYVLSNISTIVHVLTSVVKLVLIACGFSVIWLQIAQLLLVIGQVFFYVIYIKRHYAWLNIKAEPNNQAISQKESVLLHEISWMLFNHADVLLLTMLLQDLKVVSVYVLYNTFVEMIATTIQNVNNGFTYRLGQLFNSQRKRHDQIFDCYESYYMAFSFSLYTVTYIFLIPFMKLYTAGIEDANYLLGLLPVLFVVYKALVSARSSCGSLINYAGHFKQTRWHALVETIINLVASVACIILFQNLWGVGIYGALIGTILALLFRANAMVLYANKTILGRSVWYTYKKWIINAILMLVLCYLFPLFSIPVDNYIVLIISAAVCCILVLMIFFAINTITNLKSCRVAKEYIAKSFSKMGRRGVERNEF